MIFITYFSYISQLYLILYPYVQPNQTRNTGTGKPAILKLLAMGLAITIAVSCTKEEAVILQPTPQLSQGDGNLLQYEYYDTLMVDVESEIRDALIHLQDDQALGYVPINRGIWMIETGISYLHPDHDINSDNYLVDSTFYNLTLVNNEIAEADLKAIIIERNGAIVEIEANSSIKHVATDFLVSSLQENEIQIKAYSVYLTEFSKMNTLNYCNLPPTTHDRKAGYPHICGSISNTGHAKDAAANSAKACLRKYRGPDPWSKDAEIIFYHNITTHGSMVYLVPKIPFSKDNLLGNSNASFTFHQSPFDAHGCVTKSQLDTYANVIFDDIENKILRNKKCLIHLTLHNQSNFDPTEKVLWHYNEIKTGIVGYFVFTQPLQLNYL